MASLEELQKALASRLTCTESVPAEQSTSDPLSGFDADELRQSRETLVRKRLAQIASLMPKTQQLLLADYGPMCRAFIDQHHFHGFQAPQLDAIHFARWLKRHKATSPWKLEVATWEAMRVQWGMRLFLFRVKKFQYDVSGSTGDGIEPPKRSSLWIAIRLGRWGLLRRL